MMKNHVTFFIFLQLAGLNLSAWAQKSTITGYIHNEINEPLPGATIFIRELNKGQVSDHTGTFRLDNIPPGDYSLQVSSVGYLPADRMVRVRPGSELSIQFTLEEDVALLNDILIVGESEVRQLRKQPYNLSIIDTRPVQNSNLDMSQLLGRSTGINIREEGGLGSGFDFSIHGLSGKQVKFFMDGIPMDQFGTSLTINNIPVNLVERVEVFKGMVPVSLGSDALGGAVNIITRKNTGNYLDASYSFGSFNTHRVALSSKYVLGNSGIHVKTAAFYNYSDNDYRVDVEIPDELGNLDGTVTTVPRFHDDYRSAMFQIKGGVEDQDFADQLYIGLTLSGNRNNIQHGVSMDRVFGQVYTRDEIIMPSIEYEKSGVFTEKLNVRTYASFIDGQYLVADTSSRTYDWHGNYKIKNNPSIGESRWEKSLFSFHDQTGLVTTNLDYNLDARQSLLFNHTFSRFVRVGEDPYDPNIVPFSDPNFLNKNILGLEYRLSLFDERLATTFFSKYYQFRARTIDVDWDNEQTINMTNFNKPGYGLASTWFVMESLQLKLSLEQTYRLPEGYELFGDGLLTLNNAFLEPEESRNLNAGFLFHRVNRNHKVNVETNYFYRGTENLIRIEATGITSQYVNLARATISGMESEVNWQYKKRFFLGGNLTYQNIINKTRFDGDRESNVYLDRIPNIPYFFANLTAGIRFQEMIRPNDEFGLNWYTRYIHQYYLKWPSQGDPDNKHVIPTQMIHNIELTYSLDEGRYNFAAGSTNLFNAMAFDKFRVQKPGRALYVKLRYFISNQ